MKRVGIIGGETHVGELSALNGEKLVIAGAFVRPDQADAAAAEFNCPIFDSIDALEWTTGRRVVKLTAQTGTLDNADDPEIRDHASVYCQMDDGSTAVVQGQRMLPDGKGSDYRAHVAGTRGYADMDFVSGALTVTDPGGGDVPIRVPAEPVSVVRDWLDGGSVVPQSASLRANRLALLAAMSAEENRTVEVPA